MFAFFSVLKEAIPGNTFSSGLDFLTLSFVEPGVFHNSQETACGQDSALGTIFKNIFVECVCVCVCVVFVHVVCV